MASGSVDYFLKIEGVDGESGDKQHAKEIEIESFSWGESQEGASAGGSGGGAGKVAMQDFHFVTRTNKSSPKLFLGCANGEVFPKATLVCRKAGKEQQEYLKWTMSDVLVSSYQIGGSAGNGAIPADQVTLNFAKIEVEYKPQKPDGSLDSPVTAGWNLKENAKV